MTAVKTVVLDDDPTGTQCATGVDVLFDADRTAIADVLARAESVYLQTNSRSIDEPAAIRLSIRLRSEVEAAAATLGVAVRFVLRGDSTLRGHVFAESSVFEGPDSVLVFVPAFPAGGRATIGGVHYVEHDGARVPAAETEYAADPVFPFRSSALADYVAEKSGRRAIGCPIDDVRGGRLGAVLAAAPAGSVVVPDAETDEDIRLIAAAIGEAGDGRLVIRCAAPLAAMLAGVVSDGLLRGPLAAPDAAVLVACGSHTGGATAQLARLESLAGERIEVDTDAAIRDPALEGSRLAAAAVAALSTDRIAVIASQRVRRADHHTLVHGEAVMAALVTAVRGALPAAAVVVSKGGITSSDVASRGIGARRAHVLGQVLPGVSVWRLQDRTGRELLDVIVPGNVGGPGVLVDAVRAAVGDRVTRPPEWGACPIPSS